MRGAWGEVVVMYGDTPVAVWHLRREAGRRVPPWALLGLGGLMLLTGAASFFADVHQDWGAHAAARRVAQERGEPRPDAPGPGLGGLGVALALLGLVPLVLGGVRLADPRRRSFTIGEAHHASFQVATPGLPGVTFPLLRAEAGPVLRFTAATRGELWTADAHGPLTAAITGDHEVHQLALTPGSRARIEHGPLRFHIAAVEPETTKIARARLDGPTWFYSGSAALVLGGLLLTSHWLPASATIGDLELDLDGPPPVGSLLKREVAAPGPPGGPAPSLAPGPTSGPASVGRGHRAGTPRARRTGPPGAPQLGRDHDPERAARNAGLLALMSAGLGPALTTGMFAPSAGDADVWTGQTGTQIGERNDVGGLGLVGTGPGGALHGEGAIGLGAVGLIGKGGTCHCGDGGFKTGSGAGFGGRARRTPEVRLARAEVQGALDPDLVRRVVRAHLMEVRHCYDQTLARDPRAHGRVVVQFLVDGAGKVTSAALAESDVRDTDLGPCVARAVRRWSFPRPDGGGSVLISYPFVFTPA